MSSAWITLKGRTPRWVPLLVALLALASVLILKLGPIGTPAKWDECLYAYDAQRVTQGQVPYRDFFNFTPPAIFYAVAGWSHLWGGAHPLTEGRYLAVLLALASWGLTVRALRRASWGLARSLLAASFYPIGLFLLWPIPSHHWLGNLLFLATLEAWDFGAGAVENGWGWRWVGAVLGLSLFTLQTTCIEIAVFWGLVWAVTERRRGAAALRSFEGVAIVVVPVLLAFWWAGALGPMLRDTVLWTARNYGSAGGPNSVGLLADLPDRLSALWRRPESVGPGSWFLWAAAGTLVYTALLALGALLLGLSLRELAREVRRRTMGTGLASAAMAVTLVDVSLFVKGKTDILHLVYLLGPVALTWALAFPPPSDRRSSVGRFLTASVAATLLAAGIFHLSFLFYHRTEAWEFADVDRPTREAPVNRWLRAQPWLLPGDALAAFPEGGQVYLYTRPAAVGYTLLLPLRDRYNTPGDHEAVASQLVRARPRAVLLTAEREADYLDPASAVTTVLRSEYERLAVVGDAVVYRRISRP